jgi:phosphatidylethanolamine/phosphatidyl-N-methylethanolamine N-methyltransferase
MPDATNGPGLREHAFLFSRFLRSPRTVGALTASSRALAEAMVAGRDFSGPCRIVELGPGTGALTTAIVQRLGVQARFLAVDIDPVFIEQLRVRWPQIECVCASAEGLEPLLVQRGLMPVDHIISGLPFVSLPPTMTRGILAAIDGSLRPGGTFTTFQYLHGYGLPPGVNLRRNLSAKLGGAPEVRIVMRNLPPAAVLTWTKR